MAKTQSPLKPVSFLRRHRFALFFFLYLVAYHVIVVNRLKPWKLSVITYSFHSVDFSCGFATKLLPGAIFNGLFGSNANEATAAVFHTVLIFAFFFGVCCLLEKWMLRVSALHRGAAFFLQLFYLSGPYTFAVFTDELGMLDVYWLFFSLLFFCFLENRALRFLIPLLFVGALMIHYSAMLNCIILFSILLLYRASVAEEKKERRAFLLMFAVSVMATVAAFLFFVLTEPRSVCSIDEFHRIMESHGSSYFEYYDYAFYDLFQGKFFLPQEVSSMPGSLSKIILTVLYRIRFNFDLIHEIGPDVPLALFGGLLLILPALTIAFRFLALCFRSASNGLGRFCLLLMLLQFPLLLVIAMLFSIDANRWLTHEFLILFTCLLAVLYYEKDRRSLFFERFGAVLGDFYAKLYFLLYASIHFWAYF